MEPIHAYKGYRDKQKRREYLRKKMQEYRRQQVQRQRAINKALGLDQVKKLIQQDHQLFRLVYGQQNRRRKRKK